MSMGYGAIAVLETEDEQTAVYRYGGFNLNIKKCRNPDRILDGYIWIERSALQQPEIHDKLKHLPNGKKERIIKRIPILQPVEEPLHLGQFKIENCSFCWKLSAEQYDLIAIHLIENISAEYQMTGSLPKRTHFIC